MTEPHTHPTGPLADASVRTARPSDAPAMGMVQAVVFRETYADRLPEAVIAQFQPDAFARAWRRSLEQPPSTKHRALVACAGDQVVGFAALGPITDTDKAVSAGAGELSVVVVHPDARRVGHGSRLLNATADTMRAVNLNGLAVWIPATDEPTRAFFVDAGLTPDGAWRERVVGPDGETLREVRLTAGL